MLANLFKVLKALCLSFHDCCHSAQRSTFQLLASVKWIAKLDEANIVRRYVVNKVKGNVDLSQRQFVVIFVVEDIHKISIEGMNIFQFRKVCKDLWQLVVKTLLCKSDFAHVKITDARNLVLLVHNGRCFPLCLRQNDVDEVLSERVTTWTHVRTKYS